MKLIINQLEFVVHVNFFLKNAIASIKVVDYKKSVVLKKLNVPHVVQF